MIVNDVLKITESNVEFELVESSYPNWFEDEEKRLFEKPMPIRDFYANKELYEKYKDYEIVGFNCYNGILVIVIHKDKSE